MGERNNGLDEQNKLQVMEERVEELKKAYKALKIIDAGSVA